MRFLRAILFSTMTLAAAAFARAADAPAPSGLTPVWEATLPKFDAGAYDAKVELMLSKYEESTGRKLAPGPKKKVGLKIYTDSGPGMATPIALVKAVIAAMERRGFETENIFIVGLNQLRLRMTGYLPAYAQGDYPFKGHPVYVLESGRYYDPVWFYDSPLPSRFDSIFAEKSVEDQNPNTTREQDRKSFLATPLFLDADFWINLPVFTDHQILGINGSLVNATLWNASNTARFFRSPANAPAAVAEMSAIPELRQTWALTIASLEHYQYIGGPYFNSLYTVSEPVLWLSSDPVALDSMVLERINRWRERNGFRAISEDIHTLGFAETLGVGSTRITPDRVINVDK
ncbi:DUF362 domain-containing protein [Ereboglobus luteus]|uniref:DUF362 domain-containing protein n=2 Tax=Ereboglobus luteus TaxID=1796921 RepID=A0A2U8DZT4_9BACT|nr:DUF362 domain-containing protein [Ereboglobus luteus]